MSRAQAAGAEAIVVEHAAVAADAAAKNAPLRDES